MTHYLLEPCRTSAGFMSTLKGEVRLDLGRTASLLRDADYEVTDAGPLLVVKKEVELTLYRNGKTIVKTNDREKAEKSVSEIYSLILPERGETRSKPCWTPRPSSWAGIRRWMRCSQRPMSSEN